VLPERISIRDLAKIAGVSRTTVSLALRDSHKISGSVRKRIQDLASKNNYQSHPMVAALMQQIRVKKRIQDEEILAFITSGLDPDEWKSSPYVSYLFNGAAGEAKRFGFRLETFWAGPGAKNSRNLSNMLYHRGIRGLLFAPMLWPHPVLSFPWEKFVSIACTASTGVKELPVVRSNHIRGAQLVLVEIAKLGANSIGVVITENDDLRIERRWSLGVHAFRMQHTETRTELLLLPDYTAEGDFTAWYKRHRPEALVMLRTDIIGQFLKKLDRTLGKDVPFASLDASPADLGKVAGFYQDPSYLGRKAVQYISRAIYDLSLGPPDHPESIVVDGRFVEGSSLNPLLKKRSRKAPQETALAIKHN